MEPNKDRRKGKKKRLRLSTLRKSRSLAKRRSIKMNKEHGSLATNPFKPPLQDLQEPCHAHQVDENLDVQVITVQALVHNETDINKHNRITSESRDFLRQGNSKENNQIEYDYDAITSYDLEPASESLTPCFDSRHSFTEEDKENNMNMCNIHTNKIQHDAAPDNSVLGLESSTPYLNEILPLESLNTSVSSDTSNVAVEIEKDTDVDGCGGLLEGNRIVDISFLLEQLQNIKHDPFNCTLSQLEFIKEKRTGFFSTFYFKCKMCNKTEVVYSQRCEKNNTINASAVQGISQTGNGYAQLNEICASLNVPNMSEKYYMKQNEYLSAVQKDIAFQHMLQAGAEERQLAIDNNEIDSDGIPYITVVTDGSWAKRSYGTNYNSLSGVGCIIGYRTKKVLFIGVRNSYCSVCAVATNAKREIPAHKCFKNWSRQSTEMETDAIVEGFKISIQMHGLKYTRLIGDGDSSVSNALRDNMPYGPNVHIRKIECSNHLLRNYTNKLRKIAKKTVNKVGFVPAILRKTLLDRIRRLRNAVTGAIEHSRELNDSTEEKFRTLKEDLRNGPCHVFGSHDCCKSYYCKNRNVDENLVPQLKTCGMWTDIYEHLGYLLQHTESLLLLETNNPAEQFNSVIAKFLAGKRVNFALRGTYESRCYNAVTTYNAKDYSLLAKVQQKMLPGRQYTFTDKYIETMNKKLESQRKRRASDKSRGIKRAKRSRISDRYYGEVLSEPDLPQAEYEEKRNNFIQTLKMTPAEIKNLEKITVTQSNSDRWIVERKKRITASLFGQICKMKNTTPCSSILKTMLYSTFTGNDATRYGKAHEASAIADFEKKTNLVVTPCGLFIDEDIPYLGASPDGLIETDSIIEVKCPSSASSLTPMEAIRSKKITFCVETVQNGIKLKRNHNYFYQVQGQLKITKRKYCYFVVWTPNGLEYEKIEFDATFWGSEKLSKLEVFYYKCVLPEIIDPRFPRKLKFRDRF